MMIPLLGMQIISGTVAGATVFAASLSDGFFVISLVASYLIFVLAICLAQLRKTDFLREFFYRINQIYRIGSAAEDDRLMIQPAF